MTRASSVESTASDDSFALAGPDAIGGEALPDRWRPQAAASLSLVEMAREGDRDAFEALVHFWVEPAFRTAMAILGNEADARGVTGGNAEPGPMSISADGTIWFAGSTTIYRIPPDRLP